MAYTKSNRKEQKRPVFWLIKHKKWIGEPGQKDFKVLNTLAQCSHKPHEIIVDSNNKKYVVADDYSLRAL